MIPFVMSTVLNAEDSSSHTNLTAGWPAPGQGQPNLPGGGWMPRLFFVLPAVLGLSLLAAAAQARLPSTWPQAYSVQRERAGRVLTLRTPFYTVEHDLRRGGAISRIALPHGRAANLLVAPIETRVRDERGTVWTDLKDSSPKVAHQRSGQREMVTVECALVGPAGRSSGLRVKTIFDYRWGYVRIHKEFLVPPAGLGVLELCPFTTVLAPSLAHYGYREGATEAEGAPPFSFGSNRWGKQRAGLPSDPPLHTRFVPRSMIFVDPGVEGLEWFVSSDLSPWELGPAGRRGQGLCSFQPSQDPSGLALSISPLWSTNGATSLTNLYALDFSLAVPLAEGHAHRPWVHTSFNRNRGNWVSAEEIRRWADQGYQTVHCHNDGDYYDDGLFWRDGSYPPYPDMDRYDKVLRDCRRVGIRTATYFSNKELHPSTKEFQDHGATWGRKDSKGRLQHNFFRGQSEFGAQMCLRSGWLEFLKLCVDRVLKNHPLEGVYYDWNVALFCSNPLHEAQATNTPAQGHWDMDELLELMEWTRNRVGPRGLIIVHNTTTPMFAVENFADYIVATEWGYGKWTDRAPDLSDLPLEWSLAGARPRGVISYGTLDSRAPRRLHKLFALEALLGGVTPWPASAETFELLPRLKPVGDFEPCRFADWRNQAVSLSDPRCASAVYSRKDVAFLLLANLDQESKEVTCVLHPEKLPHPLPRPVAASKLVPSRTPNQAQDQPGASELSIHQFIKEGLKLTIPGDDAILIQVR
jgi:hypothetical protein